MDKTIRLKRIDLVLWAAGLAFAYGLLLNEALAQPAVPAGANAKWKTECGSCHMAYSPELLPASSWRRIMAGLDRHFGTDASLDAQSAAAIGAFLEHNAGRSAAEGTLRITETRWFRHKHDEVAASSWSHPRVKSAANCSACHGGAARGDFDEDRVRIPR